MEIFSLINLLYLLDLVEIDGLFNLFTVNYYLNYEYLFSVNNWNIYVYFLFDTKNAENHEDKKINIL